MSEIKYYKCPCKECGNNIEFPASSARSTVTCPHCGEWTELLIPEEEEETEGTGLRINVGVLVGGMVLLVVIAGVGIGGWKQYQKHVAAAKDGPSTKVAAAPLKPITPKLIPINPDSPANSEPKTNAPATPQKPIRPKSPEDLKATGVVELDKTKGSSLVYAIGTLRNDSDYDRYGVRVELDLFNNKGKKIGAAKDYKDYLGPRQEWQFRALIPEPKTVEAKVASIKEDQ